MTMSDSAKSQTELSFSSDDEVVSDALERFRTQTGMIVQEILDADGRLKYGPRHLFPTHPVLTRWLWTLSSKHKYIAAAMNEHEHQLTYRGKTFVVEYQNIHEKPQVSFFKRFDEPEEPINEAELREAVMDLQRAFRKAG